MDPTDSSSSRQAMLGDSLEAERISNNPNMERRLGRDFGGCFVNIFYTLILLTELVLWVKVSLAQSF